MLGFGAIGALAVGAADGNITGSPTMATTPSTAAVTITQVQCNTMLSLHRDLATEIENGATWSFTSDRWRRIVELNRAISSQWQQIGGF